MVEDRVMTTRDGCRLAFRFDSMRDGPVLLLCNSLGTTMGMWKPQIAAWSQHFRVLRYDQRGHGHSDAPHGAYSIDRLGRDAIELLDFLQLSDVSFCGLSLGGMVGQWLGVRFPTRLRKLVLANTSSFMGPPEAWDARIDAVRRGGMSPLAKASIERWFTERFAQADTASIDRIRAMLLGTAVDGYAGCCAAIRDMDMRRMATLIDVPTLVIGGQHDPATPPTHSEALVKAITGARITMLDAAHLSNIEVPSAFAAAVLDFLY